MTTDTAKPELKLVDKDAPSAAQTAPIIDGELVKMFEQFLAMAKSGAIKEACVVYNGPQPGDALFLDSGSVGIMTFVGMLDYVKHKMLDNVVKILGNPMVKSNPVPPSQN